MKQLTDTERLEVAMDLLTGQQRERYQLNCETLEHQPERNGFHNTPAECEDWECKDCRLDADTRAYLGIDCPYVD